SGCRRRTGGNPAPTWWTPYFAHASRNARSASFTRPGCVTLGAWAAPGITTSPRQEGSAPHSPSATERSNAVSRSPWITSEGQPISFTRWYSSSRPSTVFHGSFHPDGARLCHFAIQLD